MSTFWISTILLLLLSCNNETENSCLNNDKECLLERKYNHIAIKEEYWKKYFKKPLLERVFIAPKELLDYIKLDNKINKYNYSPNIPNPSKSFIADVKKALKSIPPEVQFLIEHRFAGIFLINDLGGTGMTDYIFDKEGNTIGSFILLDVDVLKNKNANEWATWKESTPFKKDPFFSIEAIIENPKQNNRKNAIQFILLHELGHVISVNELYHPPWDLLPNSIDDINKYTFINESWIINPFKNLYVSKYDLTTFVRRKRIVYYFGAELRGDQMLDIYDNLEATNFPTLYGAISPSEDWAESFVTYIHSVILKKPFKINIKKDGKIKKSFNLCWGTPRCKNKEKILEKIFKKD